MMEKADIKILVEQAVRDLCGAPNASINGNSQPIGGVGSFDSYSGLAATVRLEVSIGMRFGTDNIFANADGTRARKVSQVVDVIFAVANQAAGVAGE